ncbi:MAG TPA: acyl-CoA dehydrogenase family protein, partial [Nakamurella sp.]
PVLPTVLAAQLTLTDGKATTGLALPGLTARPAPDGGLLVHGTTLVLGAGEADHLLLTADDKWFLADGLPTTPTTPLDFSRSLATIHADGLHIRPDQLLPNADRIHDLAITLAVAEAAGVAAWCLRTATDYAKTREQFGRPIGSFQAVKHLCADMLCRVEQAVALAWDAARAYADGPAQHSIATAAAAAIAFDAAVDNAKDCIQILGGIGFTWEHDAHLYLRRALALRQLFGGGPFWRQRTARLALSGARRDHTVHIPTDRTEIRATVAAIAARPPAEHRAALAETGYLTPHWPKPYGTAATPAEQLAIDEELAAAGIRRPDLVIGGWAAPTILRHGTPEQCARFIAPTLRGDITWCQLFSEPDAGSDLASLRTRADRVPDGWRLTGQKVWTSLATKANWAICLARTDPTAPKHRGISYFLVDMRSAGIDIRPLREITGDAVFNEVFLDNVFVPDDCLVGPEHGGWPLARTTLANERVAMGRGSTLDDAMERLLAMTHDPADHERLGALTAQGMATSL